MSGLLFLALVALTLIDVRLVCAVAFLVGLLQWDAEQQARP